MKTGLKTIYTFVVLMATGCVSYNYDRVHMNDNNSKYDKKRIEENKVDIQKAGLKTEDVLIPWVTVEKETKDGKKETVLQHTQYLEFDIVVKLDCEDGSRTTMTANISWTAKAISNREIIRGVSPLEGGKFLMQGVDPHRAWEITFKIGSDKNADEYTFSSVGRDQYVKIKCNR